MAVIIILFLGCNTVYKIKDELTEIKDALSLLNDKIFQIEEGSEDCPAYNPCPEMSGEEKEKVKKIIIDAVRKKWPKAHPPELHENLTKRLRVSCFEHSHIHNSKTFIVNFDMDSHDIKSFIIAFDEKDNPTIFEAYKDSDSKNELHKYAKNFSKIILRENINLKKENIRQYIDLFILLVLGVDDCTKQIDSIGDIKSAGPAMQDNLNRFRDIVKPLSVNNIDNKTEITCFVWALPGRGLERRGELKKCKMVALQNGVMVSFNVELVGIIPGYLSINGVEFKDAVKLYQKGVNLYNPENYNDVQKSIECFNKAIFFNPNFTEAYCKRGRSYCFLKYYYRGIDDYNRAILINPEYTEAYKQRGLAYCQLKEYQKSIDDFSRAINIEPENPELYSARGYAYYYFEQNEFAIDDYEKAVQLAPGNRKNYSYLNMLYCSSGLDSDCCRILKKACELFGDCEGLEGCP